MRGYWNKVRIWDVLVSVIRQLRQFLLLLFLLDVVVESGSMHWINLSSSIIPPPVPPDPLEEPPKMDAILAALLVNGFELEHEVLEFFEGGQVIDIEVLPKQLAHLLHDPRQLRVPFHGLLVSELIEQAVEHRIHSLLLLRFGLIFGVYQYFLLFIDHLLLPPFTERRDTELLLVFIHSPVFLQVNLLAVLGNVGSLFIVALGDEFPAWGLNSFVFGLPVSLILGVLLDVRRDSILYLVFF